MTVHNESILQGMQSCITYSLKYKELKHVIRTKNMPRFVLATFAILLSETIDYIDFIRKAFHFLNVNSECVTFQVFIFASESFIEDCLSQTEGNMKSHSKCLPFNPYQTIYLVSFYSNNTYLLILQIILMLCSDVELNPGPKQLEIIHGNITVF